MEARRGAMRFSRATVRLADASNFIGYNVSNAMLAYLFVLIVSVITALLLTWPVIIKTVFSYWKVILTLLAPTLVQAVLLKRIIGYEVLTTATAPYRDRIIFRQGYMIYDCMELYLSIFTGITLAIVRVVLAMVLAILSLPRIDQTCYPAWIGRYIDLDTATRAYRGIVLQSHEFSNPIVVVFVRLLVEGAAARAAARRERDTGREERRRRVARRFQLAWALYKSPRLAPLRSRALVKAVVSGGGDGEDAVFQNPLLVPMV